MRFYLTVVPWCCSLVDWNT